uniref:Uncharacterized protein n=1 Tax=Schistocephalus solidus TaxID=70667 RepID=A0A0X3NU93_SCHSO
MLSHETRSLGDLRQLCLTTYYRECDWRFFAFPYQFLVRQARQSAFLSYSFPRVFNLSNVFYPLCGYSVLFFPTALTKLHWDLFCFILKYAFLFLKFALYITSGFDFQRLRPVLLIHFYFRLLLVLVK